VRDVDAVDRVLHGVFNHASQRGADVVALIASLRIAAQCPLPTLSPLAA